MRILDRYVSAIRTSNIESQPDHDETISGASDVLGAFGFAGHPVPIREDGTQRHSSPLAVALARLFCGDNHAAQEIVAILADHAWIRAKTMRVDLKPAAAEDMAKAVLAWHREGTCRACGGHGFELVPGAPAIGDNPCSACFGECKRPFEREFHPERRVVALWLLAEVEREQSKAGPIAMAKLADRL